MSADNEEFRKQQLAYVLELKASPAFDAIFGKLLLAKKAEFAEKVRDRSLTPEKRAEFVEASHFADELADKLATLEKSYKQKQT